MTFVPIDNFDRPDSTTLGPDWINERVFPPFLGIQDGNATAFGLSITGAAYVGGVDTSGGMVLTDVDLHAGRADLGVGIGDLETRDGDPYGDPTWMGGTIYIWPGYRAQFGPSSVSIVQVNMVLVDVGEAFPVATTTTDLLAVGGFVLPDGPVELAFTISGDELIAYVNGSVVLTALGTGGLGIGGGGVALWLANDAIAGGAGGEGEPPPPVVAVVSLNHPLSYRLLDGPRLSSPPVAGVSLNAKLLDGAA